MTDSSSQSHAAAVNPTLAPALTPEDAYNLLMLLERVQVQGVTEATVLGVLGHKLRALRGTFSPAVRK